MFIPRRHITNRDIVRNTDISVLARIQQKRAELDRAQTELEISRTNGDNNTDEFVENEIAAYQEAAKKEKLASRDADDNESISIVDNTTDADNRSNKESSLFDNLNKYIKSKPMRQLLSAINDLKNQQHGTYAYDSALNTVQGLTRGLVGQGGYDIISQAYNMGPKLSEQDINGLSWILDDEIKKTEANIREKGGAKYVYNYIVNPSAKSDVADDVKKLDALKKARLSLKTAINPADATVLPYVNTLDEASAFSRNLDNSVRETVRNKQAVADKYNLNSTEELDAFGIPAIMVKKANDNIANAKTQKEINFYTKQKEDLLTSLKNDGVISGNVNESTLMSLYDDYMPIAAREKDENAAYAAFDKKFGDKYKNVDAATALKYKLRSGHSDRSEGNSIFKYVGADPYEKFGQDMTLRNVEVAANNRTSGGTIEEEYAKVNAGASGNAALKHLNLVRQKELINGRLDKLRNKTLEIDKVRDDFYRKTVALTDNIKMKSGAFAKPSGLSDADNTEAEAINTAYRANEDAIKTLEAQKIMLDDGTIAGKALRSIKNNVWEHGRRYVDDSFLFGDFRDKGVGDIIKKAKAGNALTKAEKMAVDATYQKQSAEAIATVLKKEGYTSSLYDLSNGAVDMASFAIPIGGWVKAGSLVSRGGKLLSASQKLGKFGKYAGATIDVLGGVMEGSQYNRTYGAIMNAVQKGGKISNKAKWLARTGATAAEVGAIATSGLIEANTIGLGMKQESYNRYKTGILTKKAFAGEDEFGYDQEFLKNASGEYIDTEDEFENAALIETSGEYGSEHSGQLIDKIGAFVLKGKGISRISRTWLGRANRTLTKYTFGITSSLPSEFLEEVANNIFQAGMNLNDWKSVIDPQKNLDTFVHLAAAMGQQSIATAGLDKVVSSYGKFKYGRRAIADSEEILRQAFLDKYRIDNGLNAIDEETEKSLNKQFKDLMKASRVTINQEVETVLNQIKRGDLSSFEEESTVGGDILGIFGLLGKDPSQYTDQEKILVSAISQYAGTQAIVRASNKSIMDAILDNADKINGKSYNQLIASSGGVLRRKDDDSPFTLRIADETGKEIDTGIEFDVDENGNATPTISDNMRVNMQNAFSDSDTRTGSENDRVNTIRKMFAAQHKALIRNAYVYQLLRNSGRLNDILDKYEDELDDKTFSSFGTLLNRKRKYEKIGDDRYVISGSENSRKTKKIMSELQYANQIAKMSKFADIAFSDVFKAIGIDNDENSKAMWLSMYFANQRLGQLYSDASNDARSEITSIANNGKFKGDVRAAIDVLKGIIDSSSLSDEAKLAATNKITEDSIISSVVSAAISSFYNDNSILESVMKKSARKQIVDDVIETLGISGIDSKKVEGLIDNLVSSLTSNSGVKENALRFIDNQLNGIAIRGEEVLKQNGEVVEEYKHTLNNIHNAGIVTTRELLPDSDEDIFNGLFGKTINDSYGAIMRIINKDKSFSDSDVSSVRDLLTKKMFGAKTFKDSIKELASEIDKDSPTYDLIQKLLSLTSDSIESEEDILASSFIDTIDSRVDYNKFDKERKSNALRNKRIKTDVRRAHSKIGSIDVVSGDIYKVEQAVMPTVTPEPGAETTGTTTGSEQPTNTGGTKPVVTPPSAEEGSDAGTPDIGDEPKFNPVEVGSRLYDSIIGDNKTPVNTDELAAAIFNAVPGMDTDDEIRRNIDALYNYLVSELANRGCGQIIIETFNSCIIDFAENNGLSEFIPSTLNAHIASVQKNMSDGYTIPENPLLANYVYYVDDGSGTAVDAANTFIQAFSDPNNSFVFKITRGNSVVNVNDLKSYLDTLDKEVASLNGMDAVTAAQHLDSALNAIKELEFQVMLRSDGKEDVSVGYLYGGIISNASKDGGIVRDAESRLGEVMALLHSRVDLVKQIVGLIERDNGTDTINNIAVLTHVHRSMDVSEEKLQSNNDNSILKRAELTSDNVWYIPVIDNGVSTLTRVDGLGSSSVLPSSKIGQSELILKIEDEAGVERNVVFGGSNIGMFNGALTDDNARDFARFLLNNAVKDGKIDDDFIKYLNRFILMKTLDGTAGMSLRIVDSASGRTLAVSVSYIEDRNEDGSPKIITHEYNIGKPGDENSVQDNQAKNLLDIIYKRFSFNMNRENFIKTKEDPNDLIYAEEVTEKSSGRSAVIFIPGIFTAMDTSIDNVNIAKAMQVNGALISSVQAGVDGKVKLLEKSPNVYVDGVEMARIKITPATRSKIRRIGSGRQTSTGATKVENSTNGQQDTIEALNKMDNRNATLNKDNSVVYYGATSVIAADSESTQLFGGTDKDRYVGTIVDSILREFIKKRESNGTSLVGGIHINSDGTVNIEDIKEAIKSSIETSSVFVSNITGDNISLVFKKGINLESYSKLSRQNQADGLIGLLLAQSVSRSITGNNKRYAGNKESIAQIIINEYANSVKDEFEHIAKQMIEVYSSLGMQDGDIVKVDSNATSDPNTIMLFDGPAIVIENADEQITVTSGSMLPDSAAGKHVVLRGEADVLVIRKDGSVDIFDFKIADTQNTEALDEACRAKGRYCGQLNIYRYGIQKSGVNVGSMHVIAVGAAFDDASGTASFGGGVVLKNVEEVDSVELSYKNDRTGIQFTGAINKTGSSVTSSNESVMTIPTANPDDTFAVNPLSEDDPVDENTQAIIDLFGQSRAYFNSSRPLFAGSVSASYIKRDSDGSYISIDDVPRLLASSDQIRAALVSKLIDKVSSNGVKKIRLVSDLGSFGRTIVNGSNDGAVEVLIDASIIENKKAFAETVFHEFVHAALAGMENHSNRRMAVLYKRYKEYLAAGATERAIAMRAVVSNFDEFLAEFGNNSSMRDFIRWSRRDKAISAGYPSYIAKIYDAILSFIGGILEFFGFADISTNRVKSIVFSELSDMITTAAPAIGCSDGAVKRVYNRANYIEATESADGYGVDFDASEEMWDVVDAVKDVFKLSSLDEEKEIDLTIKALDSTMTAASVLALCKPGSDTVSRICSSITNGLKILRDGSFDTLTNEQIADLRVLISIIDAAISVRIPRCSKYRNDRVLYNDALTGLANEVSAYVGDESTTLYSNRNVRLIATALSISRNWFDDEFNSILDEVELAAQIMSSKNAVIVDRLSEAKKNGTFEGIIGDKSLKLNPDASGNRQKISFFGTSLISKILVNNKTIYDEYTADTTYFVRQAINASKVKLSKDDISDLFRHVNTAAEVQSIVSSIFYRYASLSVSIAGVNGVTLSPRIIKLAIKAKIDNLAKSILSDPKNASNSDIRTYETLRDLYDNISVGEGADSGAISNIVSDAIKNVNSIVNIRNEGDIESADDLQDIIQYKENPVSPIETMSKRAGFLLSLIPKLKVNKDGSISNVRSKLTGFDEFYQRRDVYQTLLTVTKGASTLGEFVSVIRIAADAQPRNAIIDGKRYNLGIVKSFYEILAKSDVGSKFGLKADTSFNAGPGFRTFDLANIFVFLNRDVVSTVSIEITNGGYELIDTKNSGDYARVELNAASSRAGGNILSVLGISNYDPTDDEQYDTILNHLSGKGGLRETCLAVKRGSQINKEKLYNIITQLGFFPSQEELDTLMEDARSTAANLVDVIDYVIGTLNDDVKLAEEDNSGNVAYRFTSSMYQYRGKPHRKSYRAVWNFVRSYTQNRVAASDFTTRNSRGEIVNLNKQSSYVESMLRKIAIAKLAADVDIRSVYASESEKISEACKLGGLVRNDIYTYSSDMSVCQINTMRLAKSGASTRPSDYRNRSKIDYLYERCALLLNGHILMPTMASNGFGETLYSKTRALVVTGSEDGNYRNALVTGDDTTVKRTSRLLNEIEARAVIEANNALRVIEDLMSIAGHNSSETSSKYDAIQDKTIFKKNFHLKKTPSKVNGEWSLEIGAGVTMPRFGKIFYEVKVGDKTEKRCLDINKLIQDRIKDHGSDMAASLSEAKAIIEIARAIYERDMSQLLEYKTEDGEEKVAIKDSIKSIAGGDGNPIGDAILFARETLFDHDKDGKRIGGESKKMINGVVDKLLRVLAENTIDVLNRDGLFDDSGYAIFDLPGVPTQNGAYNLNLNLNQRANIIRYFMAIEGLNLLSLCDFENFYGVPLSLFKDETDQTKRYQSLMSTGSEGGVFDGYEKADPKSPDTDDTIMSETTLSYLSMRDVVVNEDTESNGVFVNGAGFTIKSVFRDLAISITDRSKFNSDADYNKAIDDFVSLRMNALEAPKDEDGTIKSSDGACFITLDAYKKYLIKEGRYRLSDIDDYFKRLSNGDELSKPELIAIHQRCILSPMKLIYCGQSIDETKATEAGTSSTTKTGTVTARVMKMAVFPLLPGMCQPGSVGARLNEIAKKTGSDLIGDNEIEKFGSSEVHEIFKYNKENGLIGELAEAKNKTMVPSKIKFQMLRRQLETNPHEHAERKLGTQLMAITMGNLVDGNNNEITFYGETVSGEKICSDIMSNMKALEMNEYCRLLSEWSITDENGEPHISVAKLRSLIESSASTNNLGVDVFAAARKIGTEDAVPVSVIMSSSLFSARIMAIVKQNVQSIQTQGGAFIQVPQTLFRTIDGSGRPRLKLSNEHNAMDCYVSINLFADLLNDVDWSRWRIKHNIEGGNPHSYSVAEAREYLTENKVIGPDAEPLGVGYRVPTQSKASVSSLRIMDIVGAECGDIIVLPDGYVNITGSDFDIDKLYVAIKNKFISSNNEVVSAEEKLDEIKRKIDAYKDLKGINLKALVNKTLELQSSVLSSNMIRSYIGIMTSPEQWAETHTTIDSGSQIFKDKDVGLIKRLHTRNTGIDVKNIMVNGMENSSTSVYRNSLMYQINKKMENSGATDGIAPFALASVNHVYAQIAGLDLSARGKAILGLTGKDRTLSGVKSRDDAYITDWLSYFINAHVDAVKDPYILDFNINETTWSSASVLLRAGFGRQALFLMSQDSIRVLSAAKSLGTSASYSNYKERAKTRESNIISRYVLKMKNAINNGLVKDNVDNGAINPEIMSSIDASNIISPDKKTDSSDDRNKYMFLSDGSINHSYEFGEEAKLLFGDTSPINVRVGDKLKYQNNQIALLEAMAEMTATGANTVEYTIYNQVHDAEGNLTGYNEEKVKLNKATYAACQLILMRQMVEVDKIGSELDTVVKSCQVEQGKTGINAYGFEKYLGTIADAINQKEDGMLDTQSVRRMYSNNHFLDKILTVDSINKILLNGVSVSTMDNATTLYGGIMEATGNKYSTDRRLSAMVSSAIENESLISALNIDNRYVGDALFGDRKDLSLSAGSLWNAFCSAVTMRTVYDNVFDQSTLDSLQAMKGCNVWTPWGVIGTVIKTDVFDENNSIYIEKLKLVISRLYNDDMIIKIKIKGNDVFVNTRDLVKKIVVAALYTGGLVRSKSNAFTLLMPHAADVLIELSGKSNGAEVETEQANIVNDNSFISNKNVYEFALKYGNLNGLIHDYTFENDGSFDEFEVPDVFAYKKPNSKNKIVKASSGMPVIFISSNYELYNKTFVRVTRGGISKIYMNIARIPGLVGENIGEGDKAGLRFPSVKYSTSEEGEESLSIGPKPKTVKHACIFVEAPMMSFVNNGLNIVNSNGIFGYDDDFNNILTFGGEFVPSGSNTNLCITYINSVVKNLIDKYERLIDVDGKTKNGIDPDTKKTMDVIMTQFESGKVMLGSMSKAKGYNTYVKKNKDGKEVEETNMININDVISESTVVYTQDPNNTIEGVDTPAILTSEFLTNVVSEAVSFMNNVISTFSSVDTDDSLVRSMIDKKRNSIVKNIDKITTGINEDVVSSTLVILNGIELLDSDPYKGMKSDFIESLKSAIASAVERYHESTIKVNSSLSKDKQPGVNPKAVDNGEVNEAIENCL